MSEGAGEQEVRAQGGLCLWQPGHALLPPLADSDLEPGLSLPGPCPGGTRRGPQEWVPESAVGTLGRQLDGGVWSLERQTRASDCVQGLGSGRGRVGGPEKPNVTEAKLINGCPREGVTSQWGLALGLLAWGLGERS